jgi:ferredoxin
MPWVYGEECDGCGICVEECPVDTIHMEEDVAEIDMDGCIRCGTCHDVCPVGAVRHDGERISEEVASNVALTRKNMRECAMYLGGEQESRKCLGRMIKHFNKEKIVAEKTLEELQGLEDSPEA